MMTTAQLHKTVHTEHFVQQIIMKLFLDQKYILRKCILHHTSFGHLMSKHHIFEL
jgi:hypothetical protein